MFRVWIKHQSTVVCSGSTWQRSSQLNLLENAEILSKKLITI